MKIPISLVLDTLYIARSHQDSPLIKVIANWDRDFSFDSKNTAEEATVTPRKNAFMNAVQAEVTVSSFSFWRKKP